jgi:hypothetical protein
MTSEKTSPDQNPANTSASEPEPEGIHPHHKHREHGYRGYPLQPDDGIIAEKHKEAIEELEEEEGV